MYWVSFQFVNYYLLSNLIIALLMEEFEQDAANQRARGTTGLLDVDDIEQFGRAWSTLSPTLLLPIGRLGDLLMLLPDDLKPSYLTKSTIARFLNTLNIPSDGTHVHYLVRGC